MRAAKSNCSSQNGILRFTQNTIESTCNFGDPCETVSSSPVEFHESREISPVLFLPLADQIWPILLRWTINQSTCAASKYLSCTIVQSLKLHLQSRRRGFYSLYRARIWGQKRLYEKYGSDVCNQNSTRRRRDEMRDCRVQCDSDGCRVMPLATLRLFCLVWNFSPPLGTRMLRKIVLMDEPIFLDI